MYLIMDKDMGDYVIVKNYIKDHDGSLICFSEDLVKIIKSTPDFVETSKREQLIILVLSSTVRTGKYSIIKLKENEIRLAELLYV